MLPAHPLVTPKLAPAIHVTTCPPALAGTFLTDMAQVRQGGSLYNGIVRSGISLQGNFNIVGNLIVGQSGML